MDGMQMKKISCKRIKYLISDEKKASKEYASYGFKSLSKDEARHRKYLTKLERRKC
jgi:hypothetical protein